MDGSASPCSTQVCRYSAIIKHLCQLRLDDSFFDKYAVHPSNYLDFFLRSRNESNSIRMDTLLFPPIQETFLVSTNIDQHPSKSEPRSTSLPKTQFNKSTLTYEHLGGQLSAVLARPRALNSLNDCRDWAAIVFKLFGAVMHL